MPGQNEAEAKIGASTMRGIERFQQMGNQANYQDFLAKAVQDEQDSLTGVYEQQLDFTEGKKAAVTDSIAGMGRIAELELGMAGAEGDRASAAASQAQQTAAGNLSGAFNTVASGAMMAAGGGGGGGSSSKTGAGGGNYRNYKQSGGGMSRGDWRNI
jgi:hypothetical protein